MSPDGLRPPPEEKLLRLIRGKHAPAASTAPVPAGRGAAPPAASTAQAMAKVDWSQAATVVLAAVVVIEVVWVVAQLIRPLPEVTVQAARASIRPSVPAAIEPVPSVAASAARPLFNAPADSGGGEAARQPMSGSAKLLATRLTLTGIISSTPPQAIIEDTQNQKTYMVMVGQPLAEGAVLEQVLDNRVILDLNGEKVELGL